MRVALSGSGAMSMKWLPDPEAILSARRRTSVTPRPAGRVKTVRSMAWLVASLSTASVVGVWPVAEAAPAAEKTCRQCTSARVRRVSSSSMRAWEGWMPA